MKRFLPLLALLLLGAAPSRTQTYTAGQVISPSAVTENEDNIFSYLQAGVDTLRTGSVTSAAIVDGTIAATDIGTGAVNTTGILDGTIAAVDMATGVLPDVTTGARVHRTAGDVTTSSTTLVDFTGASITFTTKANPVILGFTGGCSTSDVAALIRGNFDIDGTAVLGTAGVRISQAVNTEIMNCSVTAMSTALTAASHTFKFQWSTDTGTSTNTMECNATNACNFWVTEITD